MLFDDMLEEHRTAGVSLRNGMRDQVQLITPAFATQRCCALGRWIHESSAGWDDISEFQQLKMAHMSFHTIALVIAVFIKQRRVADATSMLEPDSMFESAMHILSNATLLFEKRRASNISSISVQHHTLQ